MSTQCNRFVQNAWKKELCSNCFKPKEEHTGSEEALKLSVGRASTNLKTENLKLQSILRAKTTGQKTEKKKNVAFPESLTEIIGYGGDDFLSDAEDDDEEGLVECFNAEDEVIVPDSEEERALGNLTRANTSFNTITANLSEIVPPPEVNKSSTTATKPFGSLMLGRIQKDAEGRKTTLLVSVTPFGGEESLPTAKRPVDRKITPSSFLSSAKGKPADTAITENKTEVSLKNIKKIDVQPKKTDNQDQSRLQKIIDMPLITSNNLMSVIQNESSDSEHRNQVDERSKQDSNLDFNNSERKLIGKSSELKKSEDEQTKSPILARNSNSEEYEIVARIIKRSAEFQKMENNVATLEKAIELTLTPLSRPEAAEDTASDHINKVTVISKRDDSLKNVRIDENMLGERKIVGETQFNCEESRELAGEPDGKADEEEIVEPPALPKSPPPVSSKSFQAESARSPIVITEPRVSFLHGGANATDIKSKPVVPQKPITFSMKSNLSKNAIPLDLGVGGMKRTGNSVTSASIVQNILNRSGPNTDAGVNGTKEQPVEIQTASLEQCRSPLPESVPEKNEEGLTQFSQGTRLQCQTKSSESESKASLPDSGNNIVSKTILSNYKIKPPPLSLTRTQPSDGCDNEENLEIEGSSGDIQLDSVAELIRSPNKRRMAPKPPAIETEDLPASSLFARNPGANLKSDSPVVREKEKRERASSCSPKFRKAVCELPDPTIVAQSSDPVSRKTISLSQDSLTGQEIREEKKRGRPRFSLKRFLRMGTRKDVDMTGGHSTGARTDEIPSTPQPKPRLEIIHPLELDGAAVEVVGNDRIRKNNEDQTDSCGSGDANRATRPVPSGVLQHTTVRPGKPPPPPRNHSLEDWSRADKPMKPPPPRVEATKQLPPRSERSSSKSITSWQPASATVATNSDTIYANLGEVRSALAPSKPQRTASMRDQTTSQPILKKHPAPVHSQSQDYETLPNGVPSASDSPTSNDSHVYECLSSSPECDSNLVLRHGSGSHLTCKRKSDSSVVEPSVEFKFHHQPFVRSTSLPYCGSETESELYAPYGFYTSDEGPEEDQDWKNKDDEFRLCRLRQRRGRSIVHRSLEDNYGAVVIANHEALAQLLEQVNQVPQIPATFRSFKNTNLRLSDFNLDNSTFISVGKRTFCSASWNDQNVTLCIAFDLTMHVSRNEFYLTPITEFVDTVPNEIAERACIANNKDSEARVLILPRLQVATIQSFGSIAKDTQGEGVTREASFILLQFVNALKSLQARGIEEAPRNLSNVVLCRDDKDVCYRLYLLQGLNIDTCDDRDDIRVSLCQCALIAFQELHLGNKLSLIQELLMSEKATTLSQVKSVLEFSLWGPSDVTLGGPREREVTLQRWLDLERANVLHALIRTRAPLTVTDEYQLMFLVRTSAKIMWEASTLLDEQRSRLTQTN